MVSCAYGYSQPFKFITSLNCGKNKFDENRHVVYAMRSSVLVCIGTESFTSVMNMPRSRNNYDKITRK